MRISDWSSDVCSSDLLEEGKVTFPTGDAYDPSIQLLATDTIETVTVNVNVSGRAMNPQVTFSSVPGLPQDEIVSRILFGDSITSLSPLQAVQHASSDRKSKRLNSSH